MSYMKQHLEDCMDHCQSGNWVELLQALSPWKQNAPEQLFAIVQFLAEQQTEKENA